MKMQNLVMFFQLALIPVLGSAQQAKPTDLSSEQVKALVDMVEKAGVEADEGRVKTLFFPRGYLATNYGIGIHKTPVDFELTGVQLYEAPNNNGERAVWEFALSRDGKVKGISKKILESLSNEKGEEVIVATAKSAPVDVKLDDNVAAIRWKDAKEFLLARAGLKIGNIGGDQTLTFLTNHPEILEKWLKKIDKANFCEKNPKVCLGSSVANR